eukprot:1755594-Pyramimonas_sp.AAC.1
MQICTPLNLPIPVLQPRPGGDVSDMHIHELLEKMSREGWVGIVKPTARAKPTSKSKTKSDADTPEKPDPSVDYIDGGPKHWWVKQDADSLDPLYLQSLLVVKAPAKHFQPH